MPAQQITPAKGLDVEAIHVWAEVRADWIEDVEETSVDAKRVRFLSESRGALEGVRGGFRSRMATLASWESRSWTVARPRPEEPPETINVRPEIFMVVERTAEIGL